MRGLDPVARGSEDAESRNLGPSFLKILVVLINLMLVVCIEESGNGCSKNDWHCCGDGFGCVAEISVADAILDPQAVDEALILAGHSLRLL